MKINNIRGELTDISAKKKALPVATPSPYKAIQKVEGLWCV